MKSYSGTSALVSADRYGYTAAAAPAITAASPNTGSTAGGTTVTLTGTGFTGAGAVTFGGVPALSYTVNSDTSLTATAPPEAAGTVDIIVSTPSGASAAVSADHFTYTAGAVPAVTAVSPSSGPTGGGTSVTITGSAFTGATGVSFGTVAAAAYSVISDTSITATAPPEAAGTIDIRVTAYSGTSSTSSSDHYTYSAAAAPAVTSVTPHGQYGRRHRCGHPGEQLDRRQRGQIRHDSGRVLSCQFGHIHHRRRPGWRGWDH